jgi:hypothetical protein
MKVPSNLIIKGYTAGKEYVYRKSTNFYIGHFYKLRNKFYTGKDYDSNEKQLEIVPINKVRAINNPNSFLYNFLAGAQSGLNAPPILNPKPTKSEALASIEAANKQGFIPVVGVNLDSDSNAIQTNADQIQKSSTPVEVKRYFFRQLIRVIPRQYRFGEINEEQYNNNPKKPNYVTAFFTETRIEGEKPSINQDELNEAEKKMPGLKKFLGIESSVE